MNGRVGRSAVVLFLNLIFLSALIFIFLENEQASTAQSPANGSDAGVVDSHVSKRPGGDCKYGLYRKDGNGLTPVSPSEMDYADPAAIDDAALGASGAADEELPPASRQITITLNAVCVFKNDCSTLETGDALVVTYELQPATKTVILSDGSEQTVYIIPPRVDTYVAVRTPNNSLVFLDRFSTVSNQYYRKPVVFAGNMAISTLAGPLVGTLMRGNLAPGYYKIYVAMVPPGQSVYSNPDTYLSNLAELEFHYNFAQP